MYSNKQVTLQGIGTIKLDPAVVLPAGNDKDKVFVMPENAFQFEYNLKAVEDEGLVNYIVQHTRKILPLASSDLESYAILGRQFLNIGKPLVIEGVGTIHKNQEGIYQFTPGVFITPKIDDYPKQLREKRDESVSFESESKVNNSRRNLLVSISALVIILSGLAIYYMLMNKNPNETEEVLAPVVPIKDNAKMDTIIKKETDTTIKLVTPAINNDTPGFKIVLKNYPTSEAAKKAFQRLTSYGHKLVMLKVDSIHYELAMPFKTPLSDTLRAKDSLRVFFGGSPYVKY